MWSNFNVKYDWKCLRFTSDILRCKFLNITIIAKPLSKAKSDYLANQREWCTLCFK